MSNSSEPVGTLDLALAHAARLLERDPRLAAQQAGEILKVVPGHPRARLVLGAAHRIAGHTQAALEVLEPLAREQPQSAPVQLELGIARGEAGQGNAAVAALLQALRLQPDSPDAWRLLADQRDAVGDAANAKAAYGRSSGSEADRPSSRIWARAGATG